MILYGLKMNLNFLSDSLRKDRLVQWNLNFSRKKRKEKKCALAGLGKLRLNSQPNSYFKGWENFQTIIKPPKSTTSMSIDNIVCFNPLNWVDQQNTFA